ncbi:amidohydrolase [Tardiphaga alba]|uniref:Amidohydrolase n=1 Tax=Tardiphaga alba TaxID=340268 RepID=A0ABX8A9N4_9BRAD|nr:amidohydrolase family protein [Tardiphaga alba]QUS39100.1 amidohydrolase [Tardiphaga alba]
MSSTIDFHVNLLPDFARSNVNSTAIQDESDHLKHCFDLPVTAELNKRCTTPTLISEMDRANISRSVVFSYQWKSPERCETANISTLESVQANNGRLLGLAVVQPRSKESLEALEKFLDDPMMIGVKMKPRWGGFTLSDTNLMGPICEILQQRNKILLTHVSQGFHRPTGDQITDLFALLQAFPNLKVVGAHMAGFIGVYESYFPARRHFENLFIDISLPANLELLPSLMRVGNPSRYLFATDWPYVGFEEFDNLLRKTQLTDKELEQLRVTNPTALLSSIGIT